MKKNIFKTISLIMIFFTSLFLVNAETENNLLSWQFEEGAGTITLDSSGNNFNGIITGAGYDSGTKKYGD